MRAVVCSRLEGPDSLTVGELPEPDLEPGSVRVRVRAAGVNFPDILVTQGLYQEQPDLPFAPGVELAGDVIETSEDVSTFAPGDRVFGYVSHGAFAEEAIVPSGRLFPLPDAMGYETGAALPITYGTAYHALVDRAVVSPGEVVLVLGGAGGVGMAAVQIANALGATVIAAVSSDEKETAVRSSGAASVVRYDRDDLRAELRRLAPSGVDVVYDPVGGESTEAAFRSLAWKGRHLVIGFASGTIPSVAANLTLLKGASLVGVFWGRFADTEPSSNWANFDALTEWWQAGTIDPVISNVYPLEEAPEALRQIGARRAIGKLVVTP
ncbi:NADPH:quinone oxidoreductase family protein [soil metagenome]